MPLVVPPATRCALLPTLHDCPEPSETVAMTQVKDTDYLAEQMLRDYDAHTPGTPFADGLRVSIDEAYQLQKRVARLREQRGEHLVGYKIGCVCPGNQERNGLSHPVYGRLWSTEQHASDVALDTNEFANVAIEGELAISLCRDVEPTDTSIHVIAAAVDQVFTVIELHNLVFHSDHPRGAELIANNAIHAGVVCSAGTRPPTISTCTELSVALDGRTVAHWSGRRWPDDVLQAVPWLVAELAKGGCQLKAGQTVLTGAWGPPLPLERQGPAGTPVRHPSGWDNLRGNVESGERRIVGRVEVVSTLFGGVGASFSSFE